MLLELSIFAEGIRSEMKDGLRSDEERLQYLSSRLYALNKDLTVRADAFSSLLGEGSRAVTALLATVNVVTATALILLLTWHTRRLLLERKVVEDALHAEKERLAFSWRRMIP